MVRCMVLGADPKAECNEFGRLWELMETIYHQPETRGVWSGAISTFKFKQALDNSRVLYRARPSTIPACSIVPPCWGEW